MSFSDALHDRQSRPAADRRALQTVGLLFAIATLIVIAAAWLAVRCQLGAPADLVEQADTSHLTTTDI